MNKAEHVGLLSKLSEIQRDLIGQKIVYVGFDSEVNSLFGFTIETEYIKIHVEVTTDCCQYISCEIENKK